MARARARHGDTFDYSETRYVRATEPVWVGCSDHGSFSVAARAHLAGTGCARCNASHGERAGRR